MALLSRANALSRHLQKANPEISKILAYPDFAFQIIKKTYINWVLIITWGFKELITCYVNKLISQ